MSRDNIRIVYVAGAYSAPDIITALDNMRMGMNLAKDVLVAGFSPFCPWLDYQLFLQLGHGESITLDQIKSYSLDFLKISDAVLLTPNPRNYKSLGTKHEVACAEDLGIPVFHSLRELINAARPKNRP